MNRASADTAHDDADARGPTDTGVFQVVSSMVSAITLSGVASGLALDRLLGSAEMALSALIDQNSQVSARGLLSMLRVIDHAIGDRNLAVTLAPLIPTSAYGPAQLIVSGAPDLRSALESLVTHGEMIATGMQLSMEVSPGSIRARTSHPFDEVDGGLGVEFVFTATTKVLRERFGEAIQLVQFRHRSRGGQEALEAFFGCPVEFDQAHNQVFIAHSPDAANTPGESPTAHSFHHHVSHTRRHLGMTQADAISDVRTAVHAAANRRDYRPDAVAKELGVGVRNLQRRLQTENTSLTVLLTEVRSTRAKDLLLSDRLSVEEVAEHLGFASERGFRKAFLRWTGVSPAEYRRR